MPKVSVVIPAFNALRYLPRTVDSALAQSFGDFEVLIVDDESTDGTADWVRTIADRRVRLLEQKNQGAAAARNAGIRQARGEYIAFLDADDLWEPAKLERQVACLDARPEVGVVYTWVRVIDQDGEPTGSLYRPGDEGRIWPQLVRVNNIYPSAAMVRRQCFERVGLFDLELRFAEDWEMWLRIAADYAFAVLREPLMRYRRHPQCKSKKSSEAGLLKVMDKAFERGPEHLQHLKAECYGRIYLYLGWKALERGESVEAWNWRSRAVAYCPRLWRCSPSLRLTAAIAMQQYLSADTYREVATFARKLRSILSP
ncbi:glycosyltransferase [Gloeobacter morelensis]|uniref:Glycosyltransferase n=1 Tax=Gloeobacter morelensis MG652769 TaxID=2781736 RepID=A0ABY3PSF1_9CYAN|nr:glycosyltransferase [Gloeobacter morelensis]UFP96580.1 glycosyltransferase [Gloeobacter morelensis MG652769]